MSAPSFWEYRTTYLSDPTAPNGVTVVKPLANIAAPPRTPLPFGLFSILTFPDTTARWELGAKIVDGLPCGIAETISGDPCYDDEENEFPGFNAPADSDTTEEGWDPFTVYGFYECAPIGNDLQWAQERAVAHLFATEQTAAETSFWTKLIAATTSTNTTAGDYTEALGTLERVMGMEYSSLGVIHVGRLAATYLSEAGLVEAKGNRLQTKLGTPVVVGSGYDTAADEKLILTPALFGYRSEVFEPTQFPGDLLDRGQNDLYGLAARDYIVGAENCGMRQVTIERTTP